MVVVSQLSLLPICSVAMNFVVRAELRHFDFDISSSFVTEISPAVRRRVRNPSAED